MEKKSPTITNFPSKMKKFVVFVQQKVAENISTEIFGLLLIIIILCQNHCFIAFFWCFFKNPKGLVRLFFAIAILPIYMKSNCVTGLKKNE